MRLPYFDHKPSTALIPSVRFANICDPPAAETTMLLYVSLPQISFAAPILSQNIDYSPDNSPDLRHWFRP